MNKSYFSQNQGGSVNIASAPFMLSVYAGSSSVVSDDIYAEVQLNFYDGKQYYLCKDWLGHSINLSSHNADNIFLPDPGIPGVKINSSLTSVYIKVEFSNQFYRQLTLYEVYDNYSGSTNEYTDSGYYISGLFTWETPTKVSDIGTDTWNIWGSVNVD